MLLVLMFSKFFYLASITSDYEFYLIHEFGVSMHVDANLLAVFLSDVRPPEPGAAPLPRHRSGRPPTARA